MRQLSFERYRFPSDIFRDSGWLYARFTLSYRDVEEMLAERGLDIFYGTVRLTELVSKVCKVRGFKPPVYATRPGRQSGSA